LGGGKSGLIEEVSSHIHRGKEKSSKEQRIYLAHGTGKGVRECAPSVEKLGVRKPKEGSIKRVPKFLTGMSRNSQNYLNAKAWVGGV